MLECTIWPICYIFTVHFLSNHKLLLEASSLTCNFVIQTNLIICRGAWYMAKISKNRKVHRLCVTETLISFLLYSLENKKLGKMKNKSPIYVSEFTSLYCNDSWNSLMLLKTSFLLYHKYMIAFSWHISIFET